MIEEPYNNREIDLRFKELEEKITRNHQETLEKISESNRVSHDKHKETVAFLSEIKNQTTKTNGNVTSLKLSRAWMTGAIAVIIVIVLPLIVYIFTNLQAQIHALK